jgi:CcmD family protein
MNHTLFLIAGYSISWIGIIAYLLHLRQRERHVPGKIWNREGADE